MSGPDFGPGTQYQKTSQFSWLREVQISTSNNEKSQTNNVSKESTKHSIAVQQQLIQPALQYSNNQQCNIGSEINYLKNNCEKDTRNM